MSSLRLLLEARVILSFFKFQLKPWNLALMTNLEWWTSVNSKELIKMHGPLQCETFLNCLQSCSFRRCGETIHQTFSIFAGGAGGILERLTWQYNSTWFGFWWHKLPTLLTPRCHIIVLSLTPLLSILVSLLAIRCIVPKPRLGRSCTKGFMILSKDPK